MKQLLLIPKSTLQRIVLDQLSVRKLCTLWVPLALFMSDEKIVSSGVKKMLKKFKSGFATEVNFIVTGDETWLHYYDVPMKSQSKVWVYEDEQVPVQVRKSKSIGKRVVAVFFTKGEILITVSLEKYKTVTSKWYTENCLPRFFENLVSCAPLDSWFLHHDNAPAYWAFATQEFLEGIEVQLLEHPAYSPDLAPCHFELFPYVKLRIKGRRF